MRSHPWSPPPWPVYTPVWEMAWTPGAKLSRLCPPGMDKADNRRPDPWHDWAIEGPRHTISEEAWRDWY